MITALSALAVAAPFTGEVEVGSLRSKVAAIQEVMRDGKWRTVQVLREAAPELSLLTDEQIKSRIRDIRNRAGWKVNSKQIHEGAKGLWEYQVLKQGDQENGPFVAEPAAEAIRAADIDRNIDLDTESLPGDCFA